MRRYLTILFYALATMGLFITAFTVTEHLWALHPLDVVVVWIALVALANEFSRVIVKAWAKDIQSAD